MKTYSDYLHAIHLHTVPVATMSLALMIMIQVGTFYTMILSLGKAAAQLVSNSSYLSMDKASGRSD